MGEVVLGFENKPHHECGVAAYFHLDPEFTDAGLKVGEGIYAQQHRGQAAAGIAVSDGIGIRVNKGLGLISTVFPNEASIKSIGDAKMALAHTRWGTIFTDDYFGAAGPHLTWEKNTDRYIATTHNGQINNVETLCQEMGWDSSNFPSDSAFLNEFIGYWCYKEKDLTTGVMKAMPRLEGAICVVVMDENEMVAARDKNGYHPLEMGMDENGRAYAFASETVGLQAMGVNFLQEVEPGQVITVRTSGEIVKNRYADADPTLCMFEFFYFARPTSVIKGREVHESRKHFGKTLVHERPVEADKVIGSPDSGIAAALGYAEESGIPYSVGIEKDRYSGRVYTAEGEVAQLAASARKHSGIESELKGQRIIVVDDSLVNGMTSRRLGVILREAGAVEVHLRLTSPPIINECEDGVAMDQARLFAAQQKGVKSEIEDAIAKALGLDSVAYLGVRSTAESIGMQLGEFCTKCFLPDGASVEVALRNSEK